MSVRQSPPAPRVSTTAAASSSSAQKRPKYRAQPPPSTILESPTSPASTAEWSASPPPSMAQQSNGITSPPRFQPVHPSALTAAVRSKAFATTGSGSTTTTPARVKRVGSVSEADGAQSGNVPASGESRAAQDDELRMAQQMRQQLAQASSPTGSPKRLRTARQPIPPPAVDSWSLQAELADLPDESAHEQQPAPHAASSKITSAAATPAVSARATSPENEEDLSVLMQPIDASRAQLEAEIARLQALLAQSPAANAAASVQNEQPRRRKASSEQQHHQQSEDHPSYAEVVATSVSAPHPSSAPAAASAAQPAPAASSPPRKARAARRGMYMRSRTPDPLDASSWLETPSATLKEARLRVRQREATIREYIQTTARLWVVTLIKFGLEQLIALRGSSAARALLSLPHVRELLSFTFTTSTRVLDYTLHSRVFSWVPFSSLLLSFLHDPTLAALFHSMPSLPTVAVQPWMEGPLRPLFELVHRKVPLASWVFTVPPREGEEGGATAAGDKGVRPIHAAASPYASTQISPNASYSPLPPGSAPAASGSPIPSLHTSLISELLTRIESQAAVIAFLQADRQALADSIEEIRDSQQRVVEQMEQARERERRERAPMEQTGLRRRGAPSHGQSRSQQEVEYSEYEENPLAEEHVASSAHGHHYSAPVTSIVTSPPSSIPPSTRSAFITAAAEARLQELYLENVELRGLAGAQESSLSSQEMAIQAMTEEAEVLADRIYELEAELEEKKQATAVPGEQ